MNDRPDIAGDCSRSIVNDCWNKIGVYGDASCPELEQHVHCRNCPVYSAGAMVLLDGDLPVNYLSDWTNHFAQPAEAAELDTQSVVIFRVGAEWFALSTGVVSEVVNLIPIHSLPHRRSGVVMGLASVRGQLLVCVSLGQLFGLEVAVAPEREKVRTAHARLLVIRREDLRTVCPVDEVHGIHRFHPRESREVPATVAKATATYSRAVLSWNKHSVALLDDDLLFYMLKRSIA
jgi:chemotaxis-related protein WspD